MAVKQPKDLKKKKKKWAKNTIEKEFTVSTLLIFLKKKKG